MELARSSSADPSLHPFSSKYFKPRGVIWGRKTPWTGDTTNQALVAEQNRKKIQIMKPKLSRITLGVLLAGALSARADAVLDWNAISAQVIFAAGRPGPTAVLDLAVVQASVHDAIQAYNKAFEPYATEISGASGSPDAAVAKACRDVLLNRFPEIGRAHV